MKAKCPPKPTLRERRLLTLRQADEVALLFDVLANETRLRILHAIAKENELCVSDIASQLDMKPQAISNQLQKLWDRKVVESRREGNQIFYRIVDPCVTALLDQGLCLVEDGKPGGS